MLRTIFLLGSVFAAWLLGNAQPLRASILYYSVERGVTVDGATFSSSTPGIFNATHSSTNDFGRASASVYSYVGDGLISLNGWAEINAASNEEFSPDGRAIIFLDATFSVDRQYVYDLTALLIGTSEDEHWRASLSLIGPATNIGHSVVDHFAQINQSGILLPGDYVFSVRARPEVLGGLDGGSATAYIAGSFSEPNLTLVLTPFTDPTHSMPEPSTMAVFSWLGVIALATRPRARE